MKNKETNKSVLADLRSVRDTISRALKGKSPEEIVAYLKQQKTLHPPSVWKHNPSTECPSR